MAEDPLELLDTAEKAALELEILLLRAPKQDAKALRNIKTIRVAIEHLQAMQRTRES